MNRREQRKRRELPFVLLDIHPSNEERAVNLGRQFRAEMNLRKPATKLGFTRLRMARPQSSPAKLARRSAHTIHELQPPPCGRLAQQLDQHPLRFGTGIRRLRSHHACSLPAITARVETRPGARLSPAAARSQAERAWICPSRLFVPIYCGSGDPRSASVATPPRCVRSWFHFGIRVEAAYLRVFQETENSVKEGSSRRL